MKYKNFIINNYRAIKGPMTIDLENTRLMPIVGINECGKTTILKAIYCFDFSNDKNYDGKHLISLDNLYTTTTKEEHRIDATISSDSKDLKNTLYRIKEVKGLGDELSSEIIDSINLEENEFVISRNLETKKYVIDVLDMISEDIQDQICKEIIKESLPCILYNDDFNDRPPANIHIPSPEEEGNEWFHIFEQVFKEANQDINEIMQIDNSQKRKTIIKSVEKNLNKTLTESWNKFKLTKTMGNINISLDLNTETRNLNISIEENINKEDYFFEIDDRSKGFIWYYNFIMKTKYNSKSSSDEKNMIFLLDEPGSYLHFAAQDQLCEKIRDISKNNAIVIYCTHSHHMLNLKYIPLNTIYIVEKVNKNIVLKSATQIQTITSKQNALQPIYEAICIPLFDKYFSDENILMVEGIYDLYSIELFCDLKYDIKIFASTSCNDMIKNIPYFMLYGKKYIALWDNDKAGINSKKDATQKFGLIEANKFKLLPPIKTDGDRRMEEMYADGDLQKIAKELKLPLDSDYETVISNLYVSSSAKKNKIKKVLSASTISNFEKLSELINKSYERIYINNK